MVPDPHMITYPRMMALEARIRKQMKKLRELPQKRQPALTVLAFEPAPMYIHAGKAGPSGHAELAHL